MDKHQTKQSMQKLQNEIDTILDDQRIMQKHFLESCNVKAVLEIVDGRTPEEAIQAAVNRPGFDAKNAFVMHDDRLVADYVVIAFDSEDLTGEDADRLIDSLTYETHYSEEESDFIANVPGVIFDVRV